MHIVPVIDIKARQAVRAIAGRREQYQPLSSKLCNSSELPVVLEALRALQPFDTFYLADIDRIMGQGDNRMAIAALCQQHSEQTFWLDAGFTRPDDVACLQEQHNIIPVFGSESLSSMDDYQTLRRAAGKQCVLSLDYLHDRFHGPVELEHRPDLWPDTVLVMELDRVGTGTGPHYRRLAEYTAEQRHYRIYTAGGVRGVDDLARLQEAHVNGALIATALHDGTLNRQTLAPYAVKPLH
jgi:phosphoribosylformimino-5-aminoimidazole carboxamide ribotide isomerase